MATIFQKSRRDQWLDGPPRVVTRLLCSFSEWSGGSYQYSSACGFGWTFQGYINGSGDRPVFTLYLNPNLCSGMSLSVPSISVHIEHISSTDATIPRTYQTQHNSWATNRGQLVLVSNYAVYRQSQIEITVSLTLDSSYEPCFPEPLPPPKPSKVLVDLVQAFLRKPSPADTKLYAYSAKIDRQATRPKPLFGHSSVLRDSAIYWETMLSETGFKHGIPCDLFTEDRAVIRKLSSADYGYESDSDLESISDDEVKPEESVEVELGELSIDDDDDEQKTKANSPSVSRLGKPVSQKATGLAYAINGTAYRTLETYILYAYTNAIEFNPLRSTSRSQKFRSTGKNNEVTRCSPKSMYRFADYAGIPVLKAEAKAGIERCLTKENIVSELFCSFTSRYDEIIEMETDFLVKNFSTEVEHALNRVVHTKQYCSRTLLFAFKRLRGGSVKVAWEMANSITLA